MSIQRMPCLFIGHGSPMNAIDQNEFTDSWKILANKITKPKAILCISAHWETNGTFITGNTSPPTIHDFYGFPPELYKIQYSAPGSSELAKKISKQLKSFNIQLDAARGYDHGAWSVLRIMYPDAKIPLIQMSIDRTQQSNFHYELGKKLSQLRKQGVLIVGSGNIVHNLHLVNFKMESGYDWAQQFDQLVKNYIKSNNHLPLIEYAQLGKQAGLAIPTNEHYIPLLYILGLQKYDDDASFFCEKTIYGSLSMTCILIG